MREYDLQYICRVIGDLSGMPIRIYQEGNCLYYHSVVTLPVDPIVVCRDSIEQITANVGYHVTEQFHYYGIINSGISKLSSGLPNKYQRLIRNCGSSVFRQMSLRRIWRILCRA